MITNSVQNVISTFTKPSRLYASDGTTLKDFDNGSALGIGINQSIPANGDIFQMFFMCINNETKLEIGTHKQSDCGIFDLYVNNVLDSSGYDDYAAAGIFIGREITLTQPIKKGYNIIEMKVNSKNGASTDYRVGVRGASLQ